MRGVYYRTKKDGTPLATPELRISATNNRTVYYDNQNAKEAALQNDEIKEGSIVLTGYADGESEVLIKQLPDWDAITTTITIPNTGYTIQHDGYAIVYGRAATAGTASYIKCNGVIVLQTSDNTTICNIVPVCKGDLITRNGIDNSGVLELPFKTVAEPLTLPVNLVPEKDKYSYTEVKTNKTWVDGKPIYRKVVSLPTAKTIGDNSYTDLGITFPSNADTMFLPEAINVYGNLMYYNNYKPIQAACRANISLAAGTNFILEYTKN